MKRRNARNLNLLVSLTSLAILLLAGAGYYYIYVQNRETYLHDRHFRVLERIGDNMVALNETYLANAKANGAQDLSMLKQQVRELVNEEINRINQARINDVQRQKQALTQAQSIASETFRRAKVDQQPIQESISPKRLPLFPETAQVSILPNKAFQLTAPGLTPYTISFD
ncbi:MAG: hypothetical protein AAFQ87_21040, partial [Bacteroidota bacterium]